MTERPALTTIPAPAIPALSPPPSDLAASLEARGPGQPRSTDPSIVNAELVRSALAAMSQAQADFMESLNIRLDEWSARIINSAEKLTALDKMLGARFDDVDSELSTLNRKADRQNELLGNLNQIVTGIRSSSESNYDMVTTVARKLERVRLFLQVPDAIANEPEADAGAGGSGGGRSSSTPSGPPR